MSTHQEKADNAAFEEYWKIDQGFHNIKDIARANWTAALKWERSHTPSQDEHPISIELLENLMPLNPQGILVNARVMPRSQVNHLVTPRLINDPNEGTTNPARKNLALSAIDSEEIRRTVSGLNHTYEVARRHCVHKEYGQCTLNHGHEGRCIHANEPREQISLSEAAKL